MSNFTNQILETLVNLDQQRKDMRDSYTKVYVNKRKAGLSESEASITAFEKIGQVYGYYFEGQPHGEIQETAETVFMLTKAGFQI